MFFYAIILFQDLPENHFGEPSLLYKIFIVIYLVRFSTFLLFLFY